MPVKAVFARRSGEWWEGDFGRFESTWASIGESHANMSISPGFFSSIFATVLASYNKVTSTC